MAAAYFDRIFLYSYNDVVAFFYMFFKAYYSMTDKILVDDKIFVLKSSDLRGLTMLSILEFIAHFISEK